MLNCRLQQPNHLPNGDQSERGHKLVKCFDQLLFTLSHDYVITDHFQHLAGHQNTADHLQVERGCADLCAGCGAPSVQHVPGQL
jgi:hypothetical protein